MRKLVVFNQVSLDGYFVDAHGDMSWAHGGRPDPAWDAFVAANARGGGLLLFGRITYELMAGYWPTPLAAQNDPVVAGQMNALPKVVFSRTLTQASWANTRLVRDDPVAAAQRLKQADGPDMTVMGSGQIVARLAPAGLIDEYQLVMIPVALGQGRTLFEGVTDRLPLRLTRTRAFANGNVLLCYAPATGGAFPPHQQ